MNCIFICVFNQKKYVDMFFLLLRSIKLYGNLNDQTKILIYTSSVFMEIIKNNNWFDNDKIIFQINDNYNTIDSACKARLDLFDLPNISMFNKIIYIDTDIIITRDINPIFEIINQDVLYTLKESTINCIHHGSILFGSEINLYEDKTAFTSGILAFKNCETIRNLFKIIKSDIINRPYKFECCDQPYIIYNAFKYNLYDNKVLQNYVENISYNNSETYNINDNKIIHHFPGGPGNYKPKIKIMEEVLNKIQSDKPDQIITKILQHKLTLVSNERLHNLYKQCSKFVNTNHSFVELGVAKGGALAIMKYAAGPENKIFGFDSFEGMPNITKEDIGKYNKSCPINGFGKVGDNLSGGIETVYNTFKQLDINMENVTLVKGFFKDTLIKENISKLDSIAVLRLDGDWYESIKICLEKLYDKVIDGGVIIIDDYGHFIGAKRAVDEFRTKNHIISPLIFTDYTECWWIKGNYDNINIDIYDDIWTISTKMRTEIVEFFNEKPKYKIVEIGSYKGYTTKELSKIFSEVYAVDNNENFIQISKELNKNANNIHYVNLDIYKSTWDILPSNIDVVFIDAAHDYKAVKSDIMNSLNRFENLKYIIFDDYGVWPGVKKIVDELLVSHILIFEKYIGLTNIPGPKEIVNNTNEGIICSVNVSKTINTIINKSYTWENSKIKFLPNYKMSAFGKGDYIINGLHQITATFGGRIHDIIFNEDYTEFKSIRRRDSQVITGHLVV